MRIDDDFEQFKYVNIRELVDLARNNKLRSILQIFFGILFIAFLILMDHPQLGVHSIELSLSVAQSNLIWFGKWFLSFGSLVYILISLVHLIKAIQHEREALYMFERYHRENAL